MPGSDDLTVARMGTSRHTHVSLERLSGVARPPRPRNCSRAAPQGHLLATLPYGGAPVTTPLLGAS